MTAQPVSSKIDLIPWDYDSEDHAKRAYQQRVACGWRTEEVPGWRDKCREGTMMLYWLVLSDTLPDRDALVAKHTSRYPQELSPLHDTAAQSWAGRARTPSGKPLHPVGHIAIMLPSASELARLSLDPDGRAGYIAKLYVSYALQAGGYGSAAMRAVEAVARDQLGLDTAYLDTMQEDWQMSAEVLERFYVANGNPTPKISNETWFRKMDYVRFHSDPEGYLHVDQTTGERIWVPVIYYKKTLR